MLPKPRKALRSMSEFAPQAAMARLTAAAPVMGTPLGVFAVVGTPLALNAVPQSGEMVEGSLGWLLLLPLCMDSAKTECSATDSSSAEASDACLCYPHRKRWPRCEKEDLSGHQDATAERMARQLCWGWK